VKFTAIGGVFGFLAVTFGAFGAHVMSSHLTAHMMDVYNTGVQFQMYHALALVLVGILCKLLPSNRLLSTAGWLFTVGVILFSGSLYALSSTQTLILGAVTPLGGLCMLAGWVFFVVAVV
jgi:uncharacterized membrane protein YgdD (TMEM256/DUF423 family)